jgi:hypothetical protein
MRPVSPRRAAERDPNYLIHHPEPTLGRPLLIQRQEYAGHRRRLHDARKTVDTSPPWGYDARPHFTKEKGRSSAADAGVLAAGAPGRALRPPRPKSAGVQRPVSGRPADHHLGLRGGNRTPMPTAQSPAEAAARRLSVPSARTSSPTPSGVGQGRKAPTRAQRLVQGLSAPQREQYAGLVEALATLSLEDAHRVAEQLQRDAEERRLLLAYSGVFPVLFEAEGGADNKAPSPTTQGRVAAATASPGGSAASSPQRRPMTSRSSRGSSPSSSNNSRASSSSSARR